MIVILFPSILSTVPFKFARSPSATSTTSPVAKLCLSSSSPSFKLFTGTKKKRIYVEIQPTWFRITLSSYLPCSWISRHLVLFLVTKWRKIELSKRYFFCVDGQISKKFSLLASLWWVISETIIRYPIMLKTKFGGNFATSFTRQKCQNLKTKKTIRF